MSASLANLCFNNRDECLYQTESSYLKVSILLSNELNSFNNMFLRKIMPDLDDKLKRVQYFCTVEGGLCSCSDRLKRKKLND
jgi:hypothetical protein